MTAESMLRAFGRADSAGLSQQDLHFLCAVAANPGVKLADIAKEMRVTPPVATRCRVRIPAAWLDVKNADGRAFAISLSKLGRRHLDSFFEEDL